MTDAETVRVPQSELDGWRAFAEQVRTDGYTIRQLVARGQSQAASELLGAVIESAIVAGLGMEEAGAARPATLPRKPASPATED